MPRILVAACLLLAAGFAQSQTSQNGQTPMVAQEPVPFAPSTAPTVQPMKNAAPTLLQQNGQTLMDAGQQMMLMSSFMNFQQTPKNWSVIGYQVKQPSEALFDEAVRAISSEKYVVRVADRSKGMIQAVGKPWGRPNSCAAVFISIQSAESGESLKAIFATYAGCVADKSPQKFAASFDKDLRKLHPDLAAEK